MGRHVHAGGNRATESDGGQFDSAGTARSGPHRQFAACRLAVLCYYCGLPVRLGGDPAHPGRGVIEYPSSHVSVRDDGLPDLHLLHRFCRDRLRVGRRRRALRSGRTIRRARLGWATECYERGLPVRHHDLLGLRTAWSPTTGTCNAGPCTTATYRKRWMVREMRCASRACRYYWAGPHHQDPP
ncbi:MAG: hypothetical protein ACRDRN_17345 [Sciscionella sp.]